MNSCSVSKGQDHLEDLQHSLSVDSGQQFRELTVHKDDPVLALETGAPM